MTVLKTVRGKALPVRVVGGAGKMPVGVSKHGLISAYAKGCRCDDCKEAKRLYKPDYKRFRGRAERLAVQWVMREHPDVWQRCLGEAKETHPNG